MGLRCELPPHSNNALALVSRHKIAYRFEVMRTDRTLGEFVYGAA